MAIDPQLEKIVSYLVTTEDKVGQGTFGSGQRPWVNFSDIQKVGKFDSAGLAKLFTRQSSNDAYVKARSEKSATSGDLQTAKLASDYLAGMQRDYMMRTRSRIRTIVHAGNRAKANGMDQGPLRRNSIDWLSRIVTEGKKSGE